MKRNTALRALKTTLAPTTLSRVVRSLRQDPLVWAQMQDETFVRKACARDTEDLDYWTPGALALMTLPTNISLETLRRDPLPPLDPHTRKLVSKTVSELNIHADTITLKKAGLMALHLREIYRQNNNWGKVREQAIKPQYRTAMACLYGLLPNPIELMQSLLDLPDVFVHVLTANPLAQNHTYELLQSLLPAIDPTSQLDILKRLAPYRQLTARRFAQRMVKEPFTEQVLSKNLDTLDDFEQALQLQNTPESTIPYLHAAVQASQHRQAALTAELAYQASALGDLLSSGAAWKKAHTLHPQNNTYQASYALHLLQNNQVDEANDILRQVDDNEPNPLAQLAFSLFTLEKKDYKQARAHARRAVEAIDSSRWIEQKTQATTEKSPLAEKKPLALHQRVSFQRYFPLLLDVLTKLSMVEEAETMIKLNLTLSPNHPDTLIQGSRIAVLQDDIPLALERAYMAAALYPDRSELLRNLANTLEYAEMWQEALREHQSIVEQGDPDEPDVYTQDLRNYALCALRADKPQQAANLCQQAIQLDEDDGLAYAIFGDAMVAVGDMKTARTYLLQAVQLTPHKIAPWLSLTNVYQAMNQRQKALETMEAAVQAIPNNPTLLLTLGKMQMAEQAFTQASKTLEHARGLLPTMAIGNVPVDIAVNLGECLRKLGHLDQAIHVLEEAYELNPTHLEIAEIYANTLIKQKRPADALPPLRQLIHAGTEKPEIHINYAQTLLANGDSAEIALNALETALTLAAPQTETHAIALAVKADALIEVDKPQEAIKTYQQALETTLKDQQDWYVKLSTGLGKAALRTGQVEIATASLQEATQLDPHDAHALRLLAEAFSKAKLFKSSLEVARKSLQLENDSLINLTWFANLVFGMQATEEIGDTRRADILEAQREAVEALKRATRLSPHQLELHLQLGETQISIGQTSAAWNTFQQIPILIQDMETDENVIDALQQTANGFLKLDDANSAVACLETAKSLMEQPSEQILLALIDALEIAGNHPYTLDVIENALQTLPELPILFLKKTDMLLAMKKPEQAAICVEEALEKFPEDFSLRTKAADIQRKLGKLSIALNHQKLALKMVEPTANNAHEWLQSLAETAELSRNLLMETQARRLLEEGRIDADGKPTISPDIIPHAPLAYLCLAAEFALDEDEEVRAANLITAAIRQNERHPHVRALLTRLTARRGDCAEAAKTLNELFRQLNNTPIAEHNTPVVAAISEAALEIGAWDQAVKYAEMAACLAPFEPRYHLNHAITLTIRAETERISDRLEIIGHRPGANSLSEDTYQDFLNAMRAVEKSRLPDTGKGTIRRWHSRGTAAFQGHKTPPNKIPQQIATPQETAGTIAAFRNMGNHRGALALARHFPAHPLVQVQMLLSLTELNPAKALDLGLGLAKVGRVNGKSGLNLPMLYALIALLAQDEGRVSLTRSAMKNALEFWPTEPRWHALMARAYQLADDLPETDKEASAKAAIQHLQQAITMEPNHIPHYISLAEVHMGEDQFAEATETLQNATLVSAEHPEPWFYLANVHLVCGDLRQAAICADRAITLEPNKTRALLLRAEIALTADDAKSAYRLAEQAIDLQPDNPEILFMLSRGLEALDKPGQAIRTLEKAIALTKDNLPLQLERIRLLEGHKGTGAALSAFAPILKQRPDDPLLLAPLAEMLARGNHLEKAIETAQAALRSAKQRNGSPTNLTQEEQARLYLLLGKLEARLGLLDDAVQHLNTATKYAPNSFPAYLELGKVHHLRRENDLALTAFEQAIRISPNDSRPYYEAGMALHAVKDYKYAEEMLRYAANLNPSDIEIQRQLANLVALNLVHSRPTV